MNREDYNKYYIQGSDHYLIPKYEFIELFNEMSNWKEETKELNQKYLNSVADYEKTEFEKEQLNILVNSCQEEIRRLKKQLEEKQNPLKGIFSQVNDDMLLRNCGAMQSEIDTYKNQQKKFIKYLEEKEKQFDILGDPKNAGACKGILRKYKEIIKE